MRCGAGHFFCSFLLVANYGHFVKTFTKFSGTYQKSQFFQHILVQPKMCGADNFFSNKKFGHEADQFLSFLLLPKYGYCYKNLKCTYHIIFISVIVKSFFC